MLLGPLAWETHNRGLVVLLMEVAFTSLQTMKEIGVF